MKSASEIWLIDVSGSMSGRRWDRLKKDLTKLYPATGVTLIAFSTGIEPFDHPDQLPNAHGSTDLAGALTACLEYMPGKVVVWSDGQPDDDADAFKAAACLPGMIDTLFFGDEKDREAIQFMEKLARTNGGRWVAKDILKGESLLTSDVKDLLGLPSPITMEA